MEQLCGVGHSVGEYVGDGRADMENNECAEGSDENEPADDVEPNQDDIDIYGQFEDDGSGIAEDAHPLLFLFDTETTGLNIYEDHIIEIAAKVTGVPTSTITQPSYSSLVHTSRNIPSKGEYIRTQIVLHIHYCDFETTVTAKTGISPTMLRQQPPLSGVLPEFIRWIASTISEVSEECNAVHYPGL